MADKVTVEPLVAGNRTTRQEQLERFREEGHYERMFYA